MFFDNFQLQLFLQVLLAAFLGALIGLEREYKRKEAGLKTFSLVSFGACFFTIVGVYLGSPQGYLSSFVSVDPVRIIQAVAIGIGFIGSGLIIFQKFQVEGLTTAATLWASAAIGIGVGVGLYFLSIIGAFLVLGILSFFRLIEEKAFHKKQKD